MMRSLRHRISTALAGKAERQRTSLAVQMRQLLIASGFLLLLLILAQFAALTVNREISARLVDKRIVPMSQLQGIASAYQASWAIADKVRMGTIDAEGGATAVQDIKTRLIADWKELQAAAPEITKDFIVERTDADVALTRLQTLLASNNREGLTFYLSGEFIGSIDPLIGRIQRTTASLRATASEDRATLRWVNFAAEMLLLFVTVGAIIGGAIVAQLGKTRLVIPLIAIADHVRNAPMDELAEATVPGTDRHDEIGAIAQALSTAQTNARAAEEARQGQRQAEAVLRNLERQDLEQRRMQEEALHQAQLEDAKRMQRRAASIDNHFARFDMALSHLVSALSQASHMMRTMAATLASASSQSSDLAQSVAANVSAAAMRVDNAQEESRGLLELVARVRESAATTRHHSSGVIDEASRNRAHARALAELVIGISRALDLIQGVAAQTNLLSVNANIEAHRSGEAGRGFTVVAREIKTLAIDSSQAAGEIAQQLAKINRTAEEFLSSAQLVEDLAGNVGAQAAAVDSLAERQADANHRMATSIAQTGAQMQAISSAARDAQSGSAALVGAAGDLRDMSDAIAGQIADLHREFSALREGLSVAA